MVSKAEVEFKHVMNVSRVHEDPIVIKPYTDSQWQEIYNAGLLVDRAIERNDIRLSMGGESTFVSIDDKDGAEWNGAALGDKTALQYGTIHRWSRRATQFTDKRSTTHRDLSTL